MDPTPYAVLGLPADATTTTAHIRQAFIHQLRSAATRTSIDQLVDAFSALSIPSLRRLYDTEPGLPPPLRPEVAAIRATFRQDPGQAAASLEALAKRRPLPPLQLAAGAMLLEVGQAKKAVRMLRRLCKRSPAPPEAKALLGMALYLDDQVGEAGAYLESALAHDPGQVEVCDALARYHLFFRESPAAAVVRLERGLAAAPANGRLLATLFLALIALGDAARLEALVEPLLEGLARAAVPIQCAAITELLSAAESPAIMEDPELAKVVMPLMPRLEHAITRIIKFALHPELEEELAALHKDPATPPWIHTFAELLRSEQAGGPFLECEGNAREVILALTRAMHRIDGPAMHAQWDAFAAAYPRLAARLQADWKGLRKAPGRR